MIKKLTAKWIKQMFEILTKSIKDISASQFKVNHTRPLQSQITFSQNLIFPKRFKPRKTPHVIAPLKLVSRRKWNVFSSLCTRGKFITLSPKESYPSSQPKERIEEGEGVGKDKLGKAAKGRMTTREVEKETMRKRKARLDVLRRNKDRPISYTAVCTEAIHFASVSSFIFLPCVSSFPSLFCASVRQHRKRNAYANVNQHVSTWQPLIWRGFAGEEIFAGGIRVCSEFTANVNVADSFGGLSVVENTFGRTGLIAWKQVLVSDGFGSSVVAVIGD